VADAQAAHRRAHDLAEVGRYADAEQIVRTGLAQAPDDAELLTMLVYLLRVQERLLDALAAGDAAVAQAPDHGEAHTQRAWTLIVMYRATDAITAATEAVRLDPHLADRHLALAAALSMNEQYDQAREAAREALRLSPRSAAALMTLAEIERNAGNPEPAAAATRQALAVDPTSTRGRRLLALLDADRGVVRRSIRTLAAVARDQPADPDLISLVWPIRRVVAAPRWWLAGAAAVVTVLGVLAALLNQPAAAAAARGAAALSCAVTAGFALRTLGLAGRLPWRALRIAPPLVRRSLGTGLAVITVAVGLLAGYAAGGPLALPPLSLACAPVLWACMMAEIVGHSLNQAGGRLFMQDSRREIRAILHEIRRWPAETRRSLHAAWHAGDDAERERKQRQATLRQPLAEYQNRLRNTILCAQFALATVLAGGVAVASRPSTGATVGFGLFALLTLYISIRVAVMKAVATPEGLVLNGPLWKAIVRWDRVAKVIAGDAKTPLGVIRVRAPVLILADDRRYIVTQTAHYDLGAGDARPRTNTPVNRIAAELEAIRLANTARPDTPSSAPGKSGIGVENS